MDNIQFQSSRIGDRSYVSMVKREIHSLARNHFSEQRGGEIDIVVSEATSNLVKHAKEGEILYRLRHEGDEPVFEMICLDNGPGIKDMANAMRDGVSTKNTLGQGLGSIMRLSSFSQIYSQSGWGTVIYSKFYNNPEYCPPKSNVQVRHINVAKPGQRVSGDGLSVRLLKDRTLIMVGDGLGHGEPAKEAVDKAREVFEKSSYSDPSEILREMHVETKRTRGLVATVAVIDHQKKEVQVCGVGNIYMRLQSGLEYRNYIANNGIVGLNVPGRLENATYGMERMQQLIFCSDGIKTKWDLVRYPNILKYDPMILAAVLYKDQSRQTDDMTILAVKVI